MIAILGWTIITSSILLLTTRHTISIRVNEEEELHWLDLGKHTQNPIPTFNLSEDEPAAALLDNLSRLG